MWFQTVALCLLFGVSRGDVLQFPAGFEFGAASAAYQIEGAWNVSGKGESVADRFAHAHPEITTDGSDGDVACDSYRQWQRDLDMVAELGLDFYRFSLSWSRLLPTGLPNEINEDGVRYYNDLIDGLLKVNVKPLVTLHHFDLPQRLEDLGGWLNPLVSEWFTDYARVAFQLFGDRVKTWITINEPLMICHLAYGMGILAPGVLDLEVAPYLCGKNVLLSHAKAWRLYDEEFRGKFQGKVSLSNIIFWREPTISDSGNTMEQAEIVQQFGGGMYSHPIYSKEGGWPPLIEKLMREKSLEEEYETSRLPPFTSEEIKLIRGTYDYYALNYYTGREVVTGRPGQPVGPWPTEGLWEFDIYARPPIGAKGVPGVVWFYDYPEGFRKTLKWIKDQYGDVEIVVTENGYPQVSQNLEDEDRIDFIRGHLTQVLLAIKEDKINITKYTVWSLMDNYEWSAGYTTRFGLYEVDFSSPLRTRTPRASARFYADVIKTRTLETPIPSSRSYMDDNETIN